MSLTSFASILHRLPVEMVFEVFKYLPRAYCPPSCLSSKYFVKRWTPLHVKHGVVKYFFHNPALETLDMTKATFMRIYTLEDGRATAYEQYDLIPNSGGLPKDLLSSADITYDGYNTIVKVTEWHGIAKVKAKYTELNGRRHGENKEWRGNGQLAGHCHYDHGELHGECKTWYSNGQLHEHCHYDHGELHNECNSSPMTTFLSVLSPVALLSKRW